MFRNTLEDFSKPFDVFVIGGGIYGAWIAYDANRRGLRTAIVEQNDWAGATSSASSKLIHGGLRYLEQMSFSLVKKNLKERKILSELAPHQVKPIRFIIPDYKTNRVSGWKFSAALKIYDYLAGKNSISKKSKKIKKNQLLELAPFLNSDGLHGGFEYGDCQEDDARLTLEIIESFQESGGIAANYFKATSPKYKDGKMVSIEVEDKFSEKRVQVFSKSFVFATGAWNLFPEHFESKIRYTKGIHIVVPRFDCEKALLFMNPSDGRVFFMIPWLDRTLIGTTDTDFKGDVSMVKCEETDLNYMLEAVNSFLKTKISKEDIISSFAGLRTMLHKEGKSESDLKRDWTIGKPYKNVLVSIGGKYTSARADAVKLVDELFKSLKSKKRKSLSHLEKLAWYPNQDPSKYNVKQQNELQVLGIDSISAMGILDRHGVKTQEIIKLVNNDEKLCERIDENIPVILAELLYCARFEMVESLSDLIRRRIPIVLIYKCNESLLRKIAQILGNEKKWSIEKVEKEVEYSINLYLQ